MPLASILDAGHRDGQVVGAELEVIVRDRDGNRLLANLDTGVGCRGRVRVRDRVAGAGPEVFDRGEAVRPVVFAWDSSLSES